MKRSKQISTPYYLSIALYKPKALPVKVNSNSLLTFQASSTNTLLAFQKERTDMILKFFATRNKVKRQYQQLQPTNYVDCPSNGECHYLQVIFLDLTINFIKHVLVLVSGEEATGTARYL